MWDGAVTSTKAYQSVGILTEPKPSKYAAEVLNKIARYSMCLCMQVGTGIVISLEKRSEDICFFLTSLSSFIQITL